MRIPEEMPMKQRDSESARPDALSSEAQGLTPAGCCAQVCIDTPFGRVCHCAFEAPFC